MRVSNTVSETAPTGANTVILFDSFIAFAGLPLDVHDVVRYIATITNSQAGTIRLYKSQDGAQWDMFQSTAVGIPAGSLTVSGPLDFAIDGVRYLKVDWLNGGVTQGTWRLDQELVEKDRAAQT